VHGPGNLGGRNPPQIEGDQAGLKDLAVDLQCCLRRPGGVTFDQLNGSMGQFRAVDGDGGACHQMHRRYLGGHRSRHTHQDQPNANMGQSAASAGLEQ